MRGIDSGKGTVSIIIPARNEERHLQALIPRLKKEAGCIEIIVVDHASSDATCAVATSLGARVVPYDGATVAGARNAGARAADGDVLAFLDADCWPPDGWIATSRALLASDSELGAIGGGYAARGDTPFQRVWAGRRGVARRTGYLPTSGLIVRRSAFEECGGFAETLVSGEDVDLAERLRAGGWKERFDPRLTVTHLGEPRTLLELFRQQLWHAQGSRLTYARLGISWVHVASLVWLPGWIALAGLAMGLRSVALMILAATWGAAPVVAVARRRRGRRALSVIDRGRLLAGAFVYLLGRSLGRVRRVGPWRSEGEPTAGPGEARES